MSLIGPAPAANPTPKGFKTVSFTARVGKKPKVRVLGGK